MDIDLQTPGSGRWPIRAQLSHQLTNQRTAFISADTADQSQPSLSSQLTQLTNNSSEVGRVCDNELLNPSLLVCNMCHCHCTAHSGCSLSWAWEHGIFCFSRPRFQCSMLGNSCKYYVYSLNMLEWATIGDNSFRRERKMRSIGNMKSTKSNSWDCRTQEKVLTIIQASTSFFTDFYSINFINTAYFAENYFIFTSNMKYFCLWSISIVTAISRFR